MDEETLVLSLSLSSFNLLLPKRSFLLLRENRNSSKTLEFYHDLYISTYVHTLSLTICTRISKVGLNASGTMTYGLMVGDTIHDSHLCQSTTIHTHIRMIRMTICHFVVIIIVALINVAYYYNIIARIP